jgi:UDP:flavonoid glycosyltransferase YjiC (YdhE family)
LAVELAARGHRVAVATHDRFREAVEPAAAEFLPVVGDPRVLSETPRVRRWQESGSNPFRVTGRFRRVAAPLMERYLADCLEAVADADLVVFSALGVGAFHAAEAAGVPAWPAFLQPFTPTPAFASPLVPPWVDRLGSRVRLASHRLVQIAAWRVLAPDINRFRRRLGLPALGPYRMLEERRIPHIYGFSPTLVPPPADWPPWVHVTGHWSPPPGEGLPEELEAFLGKGPPPVFVGFGSRAHPRVEVDLVLQALGEDRVVLQPGWGGVEGEGRVLVVGRVDHRLLFPRCRLIIHHGGAGTTHTALEAGVPSIAVPSFADQFFWASRLERLGVGVAVPLRRLTARRLSHAARRAEGMAGRASEVGRTLAQEEGASRAAELISRLL